MIYYTLRRYIKHFHMFFSSDIHLNHFLKQFKFYLSLLYFILYTLKLLCTYHRSIPDENIINVYMKNIMLK